MPKSPTSRAGSGSGSFYSKAFKEGISSLMDEIRLAMQWSRPSILVAVHKSVGGQEKARTQLKKEIEALGRRVRGIEANKENLNVIQAILKSPERERSVFFISGIGRNTDAGRGAIYRALNFQRELLVDNRIILILWLGTPEAAELALQAPDFWAFRHRVVEFAPDRGAQKRSS